MSTPYMWTPSRVCSEMNQLGLGKYGSVFHGGRISGRDIPSITDPELYCIGMRSPQVNIYKNWSGNLQLPNANFTTERKLNNALGCTCGAAHKASIPEYKPIFSSTYHSHVPAKEYRTTGFEPSSTGLFRSSLDPCIRHSHSLVDGSRICKCKKISSSFDHIDSCLKYGSAYLSYGHSPCDKFTSYRSVSPCHCRRFGSHSARPASPCPCKKYSFLARSLSPEYQKPSSTIGVQSPCICKKLNTHARSHSPPRYEKLGTYSDTQSPCKCRKQRAYAKSHSPSRRYKFGIYPELQLPNTLRSKSPARSQSPSGFHKFGISSGSLSSSNARFKSPTRLQSPSTCYKSGVYSESLQSNNAIQGSSTRLRSPCMCHKYGSLSEYKSPCSSYLASRKSPCSSKREISNLSSRDYSKYLLRSRSPSPIPRKEDLFGLSDSHKFMKSRGGLGMSVYAGRSSPCAHQSVFKPRGSSPSRYDPFFNTHTTFAKHMGTTPSPKKVGGCACQKNIYYFGGNTVPCKCCKYKLNDGYAHSTFPSRICRHRMSVSPSPPALRHVPCVCQKNSLFR